MVLTEKHRHILLKAEELFAVRGFDGATVRDIADAAGVNLAMISYYFGSKEKLMEALFRERMTLMRIRLETLIMDDNYTPIQKVDILIDEYVNKVIQQQSFYKIMLCEQVINNNPLVLKMLRELKLSYANLVGVLIEAGQKQKIFKKDIDVMFLLNTMTGTVTQMVINKEYYKEYNNYKKLNAADFNELLRTKLSAHVKLVFKAILGYEQ
ncbi:MAG: hypothetical protein JWQ27_647 [Ferruginibacter sp.]|nr:hypothetical protein [Ferruginibacter sp.]